MFVDYYRGFLTLMVKKSHLNRQEHLLYIDSLKHGGGQIKVSDDYLVLFSKSGVVKFHIRLPGSSLGHTAITAPRYIAPEILESLARLKNIISPFMLTCVCGENLIKIETYDLSAEIYHDPASIVTYCDLAGHVRKMEVDIKEL